MFATGPCPGPGLQAQVLCGTLLPSPQPTDLVAELGAVLCGELPLPDAVHRPLLLRLQLLGQGGQEGQGLEEPGGQEEQQEKEEPKEEQ